MRFFLLSLALSSVSAFTPAMDKAFRTTQGVANSPLFRNNNNKVSSTERSAVLEQTELPSKLYFKQAKEMPKVLGGLKIGLRELVVITGASSGLGLNCAATLAKTGKYFVVMAVRDVEKAKRGKYVLRMRSNVACHVAPYNNNSRGALPFFLNVDSRPGNGLSRRILCRHEARTW